MPRLEESETNHNYLKSLLKMEDLWWNRHKHIGRIVEILPWNDLLSPRENTNPTIYILIEKDGQVSGYTEKFEAEGMKMLLQLTDH